MEGKVIKEETVSVGSPCSPLALPSGKENRRVGSPLTSSEILTRSRSKVLSKENSHHHHQHHHRMSESPKASAVGNGSPSPPPSSVNLSISNNKNSSNSGSGGGGSSHHTHSGASSSHAFHHQFSSPHSTTSSSGIPNGTVRRTPSPTLNASSSSSNSSSGNKNGNVSTISTGSSTGRTPTSSSSSNNSSAASSAGSNNMVHGSSGSGNSRLLVKIKRFLGTLLHFGCDISPEIGDRVRTLVFSLVSGHLSIEEFHHTLQEVTSFPLRPFVLPFLRAHLPLLQREISHVARVAKQTPLSYVQTHEQIIMDTGSSPGEPCDIFHSEASDLSLSGKRKASESFYENGEMSSESSSGYTSTPKRHHGSGSIFSPPFFMAPTSSSSADFREYYSAGYVGIPTTPGSQHHVSHSSHHHESIMTSQPGTPSNGVHCPKGGPEDEWKNIHVMLNCILGMINKTQRALGILQSRTGHSEQGEGGSSSSWLRRPSMYSALESSEDIKRQVSEMMAQAFRATEDRVTEVKRRAEEAVQEVKRQALVELKRAVAAAEARACEAVASERARLERVLLDSRRNPGDVVGNSIIVGASPAVESEACWNCGRKAHETCSGCNAARYCSSFCQHKDWENHHAVCGRSSSANSDRASGAAVENKSSHPHSHAHENSNSSPVNVSISNPSPEHNSPGSNN